MNEYFGRGFTAGLRESERQGVFHRSERAPMVSSERSRSLGAGPRDTSCGKRRRGAGEWVPVGLLINTYLNTLIFQGDNQYSV